MSSRAPSRPPCGARALISSATVPWPIEKTWKPPESVMIGRSQSMNRCRPPSCSISSSPGPQEQMEGVAEHHLVAELRDLLGQQAFDGRLRGERHEGGCTDVAVGGAQHPGARQRERVAGCDSQSGHRGILESDDGHPACQPRRGLTPSRQRWLAASAAGLAAAAAGLADRRQPPRRSLRLPAARRCS